MGNKFTTNFFSKLNLVVVYTIDFAIITIDKLLFTIIIKASIKTIANY